MFESYQDAEDFLWKNKLKGKIDFLNGKDESEGFVVTVIGGEFDGQMFYSFYSELKSSGNEGRGSSGKSDASSNSSNSFFKSMETGGIFQLWGVMRDMPGFKPNSRKRSAVDASMNYEEAYERGKTSLMKGADFWKRLKEGVSGADSRGSTLWDRLNATETNDMIKMQYNSWNVYENGSWIYEHPYIIKITKDTMIHNNQLGKSNLKNLEIRDSIIKYKILKINS